MVRAGPGRHLRRGDHGVLAGLVLSRRVAYARVQTSPGPPRRLPARRKEAQPVLTASRRPATPARSPTTTPGRHAVPGLIGQPRRHRTVLGRPRPPGTASTSTPNRPDHRWAAETRGATPAGRRRPSVRRPTKTEWQTPGAPAAQGDNAPRDRDRLRDTQEIDPRVSSFSC